MRAYSAGVGRLIAAPRYLFCGTDRMAMGACDYLKETGRRIAQDVAVVGSGNQLLISHATDAESRYAALPPHHPQIHLKPESSRHAGALPGRAEAG